MSNDTINSALCHLDDCRLVVAEKSRRVIQDRIGATTSPCHKFRLHDNLCATLSCIAVVSITRMVVLFIAFAATAITAAEARPALSLATKSGAPSDPRAPIFKLCTG